jgi:glycosyltransferase involved in cell wall biosynthesis
VLVKNYPDIEYTIVGNGPLESELRGRIKNYGLENNIKIRSGISDEELLDEYKMAGIFLLSCIRAKDGDMDGIPVVLMEAMAMGIPVISTKVSGIPELIDHGESGILVEPEDPSILASKLDKILSEKIELKAMTIKARQIVVDRYSHKKQVDQMGEIFEDVISQGT